MTHARTASLVTVLLCAAAHADPPAPKVAVQAPRELWATSARLLAELRSRGFAPVTVEPPVPLTRASLERLASDLGAIAVLSLAPNDAGLEIWVADRLTGKIVLRQVERVAGDEALLAHRGVETLRASLLELRLEGGPARAHASAVSAMLATPDEEPPPPKPAWLSLRLGPSLSLGTDGIAPNVGVELNVAALVLPQLAVGLHTRVPTVPTRIDREGARAEFLWLGVGLEAEWHPRRARLDPWVGVRASAQWLRTSGNAAPPRLGVVADGWVAVFEATVGAAFELSESLAVYVAGAAGLAAPAAVVRFSGVEVARWGLPTIGCSVGLRLGLAR